MLGETKMKKLFKKALAVFLSVLMAVSFTAFPLTASAAQSKKESKKIEYAEGEVIAVLNEGVKKNYLLAGTSSYGKGIKLKASHSFSGKKSEQLNVAVLKSGTLSTKEIIKKLKSKNHLLIENTQVNCKSGMMLAESGPCHIGSRVVITVFVRSLFPYLHLVFFRTICT